MRLPSKFPVHRNSNRHGTFFFQLKGRAPPPALEEAAERGFRFKKGNTCRHVACIHRFLRPNTQRDERAPAAFSNRFLFAYLLSRLDLLTPMHMSRLFGRSFSFLLLSLFAGAFVLAGCGNSGGSSDSDSVPYTVGDAVSDTSVALIVSSEYGSDTLSAQQYNQQAQQRLGRISPQEQSPDTIRAIHRELVRSVAGQHMMRGRAQAEDIAVDSAQVEARFQKITQRYPDQETLRKQLAQSGMTMDSLRNYIATQMKAQQLQQQMAESAESPSDEEIEAYSKENRRISAQHILLRAGQDAPQETVDSARSAATALIDSAEAGTDFSALARRHSEGPSAEQGGDLGFFTREQMVDPFAEAAFALSDSGDVAPEPVRTRFGFHVIRLTNAGEPMDTTKARQQMMQERRRDAFNAELDELLQGATIRANPEVVEAGLHE